MYPFIRLAKELLLTRRMPKLPILGTHVSHHICWPWDIDFWAELNNGRTLTIYDLGRIPLASRAGLLRALKQKGRGLSVAGVSVRYRRRVRPFERIRMNSRCIGWDDRFIYLEQTIWKTNGECANQALYRSAATDANGIANPEGLLELMGWEGPRPELPEWVQNWISAEATRPWPPEDTAA